MFCRNCGVQIDDNAKFCPSCGELVENADSNQQQNQQTYYQPQPEYQNPYQQPVTGTKNKLAAGLLGILLGSLGIHKFYLGYTKSGVIMLLVSLLGSLITFGVSAAAMEIIGIIEGIIYLTKTDEEFYNTYEINQKEWF